MVRRAAFLLLLAIPTSQAADPRAVSARYKLDLIESGRAKPGSTISFSVDELIAFVRVKIPEVV
ncbi:MAG TPA: hypothetical protein VGV35_07680, partial [Bryobacteraceae bacterium]|nr:hypothetical protein [Bryobacteraceae bacterium]